MYRFEAASVGGFVQQLAVQYLTHGYFFYVAGNVPEGKDPSQIDRKLIARYDVGLSKWAKARRRAKGEASVQYLRFGRFFLLVATHGRHPLFLEERRVLRDARKAPILFAGYSISHRGGHAHVRIAKVELDFLKADLERVSLLWPKERLESWFLSLPFDPYAPVRAQVLSLFRAVNRRRRTAGLSPIEIECVRMRRRIYRPFDEGRFEDVDEAERPMGRSAV